LGVDSLIVVKVLGWFIANQPEPKLEGSKAQSWLTAGLAKLALAVSLERPEVPLGVGSFIVVKVLDWFIANLEELNLEGSKLVANQGPATQEVSVQGPVGRERSVG